MSSSLLLPFFLSPSLTHHFPSFTLCLSATASASHQSQQCLLSMKYLVQEGLCGQIADFISPWNNRWYMCLLWVCLDWFRWQRCRGSMWRTLICLYVISVIGVSYYRFTSHGSSQIWHGCQHVNNMPGGDTVQVTYSEEREIKSDGTNHQTICQICQHKYREIEIIGRQTASSHLIFSRKQIIKYLFLF